MKKLLFFFFPLIASFLKAQTVSNYTLWPGNTFTVSPGQELKLSILLVTDKGDMYDYTLGDDLPEWTVNGNDEKHVNPSDGALRFVADFKHTNATYTAPNVAPAKNPVIINVRFHPNTKDNSVVILQCAVTITKPRFRWYISWTATQSETYFDGSKGNMGVLTGSNNEQYSKQINCSGSEIVVPQNAPDLSDDILISKENGDCIISFQQFGNYAYNYSEEETDKQGLEHKTTINANGKLSNEQHLIEFQYQQDDKTGGINAGFGFDVKSNKNTLQRTQNESGETYMKNTTSTDSSQDMFEIGSASDKITKTKDGYIIDGNLKKDTSYAKDGSAFSGTINGNEKVEKHSETTYHITITDNPPPLLPRKTGN